MKLKECGISLLSRTTVDMKTAAKTALYTCPAGKKAVVTMVVVKRPTASLAGGTVYNFGIGALSANGDWGVVAGYSLAAMTGSTHQWKIRNDFGGVIEIELQAGDIFGIYPETGSTLTANATVEVWGYEAD